MAPCTGEIMCICYRKSSSGTKKNHEHVFAFFFFFNFQRKAVGIWLYKKLML